MSRRPDGGLGLQLRCNRKSDLGQKRIFEGPFVAQCADRGRVDLDFEIARREVADWKINMQNPRQIFGDINRTFLQTRRREPNCTSPCDYPAFDTWGPPRDQRFIAVGIDANPDVGLWGPPRDYPFADGGAQLGRQAGPSSIRRRRQQPFETVLLQSISAHSGRLIMLDFQHTLLQGLPEHCSARDSGDRRRK